MIYDHSKPHNLADEQRDELIAMAIAVTMMPDLKSTDVIEHKSTAAGRSTGTLLSAEAHVWRSKPRGQRYVEVFKSARAST